MPTTQPHIYACFYTGGGGGGTYTAGAPPSGGGGGGGTGGGTSAGAVGGGGTSTAVGGGTCTYTASVTATAMFAACNANTDCAAWLTCSCANNPGSHPSCSGFGVCAVNQYWVRSSSSDSGITPGVCAACPDGSFSRPGAAQDAILAKWHNDPKGAGDKVCGCASAGEHQYTPNVTEARAEWRGILPTLTATGSDPQTGGIYCQDRGGQACASWYTDSVADTDTCPIGEANKLSQKDALDDCDALRNGGDSAEILGDCSNVLLTCLACEEACMLAARADGTTTVDDYATALQCVPCPQTSRCIDGGCIAGTTGKACASCSPRHFEVGDSCAACPDSMLLQIPAMLGALIVVGLLWEVLWVASAVQFINVGEAAAEAVMEGADLVDEAKGAAEQAVRTGRGFFHPFGRVSVY